MIDSNCERCGGRQVVISSRQQCSLYDCRRAFDEAEKELDLLLESPDREEEMAILFFDNNGDSPSARWWREMEYKEQLMAIWNQKHEELQSASNQ